MKYLIIILPVLYALLTSQSGGQKLNKLIKAKLP